MELSGVVNDGIIVADDKIPLPNGTRVKIVVQPDEQPRTLKDILQQFAGCMSGLPSDLAAQHDHYLHGTPKR